MGITRPGRLDGFKCKVYGNIMSMVDEENFATAITLTANNTFNGLFQNNAKLTDASGLLLPATTLAENCYYRMFEGCTSLTNAYVKTAYTTAYSECFDMFTGCAAAGAVLHTTATNKSSWDGVMGSGNPWNNWTVDNDY